MGISLDGKLVVAISSRALFDFEEENEVFEQADDTAYMRLQLERMDQPARPGVALGRGWTLTTGANGFATIELPNGSRTSLPTRSRLTIRQLRRFVLRQIIDYDLEVGDGKAETQVTPIPAGKGEFRIRTPRAVSAVRGTQFRVGYGEGMSSTEVLDGKVAIGYGSEPNDAVSKGFGACIGDSGKVSKEALLPAPDVLRAARAVRSAGHAGT